jgi:hypothetical protein
MTPQRLAKVALATVTAVLLISQGAQLLLPLLLPFHVWAARRSGTVGRVLWSIPPVAAAGFFAWVAVYVTAGEPKPAIWLLPAIAAIAAGLALAPATRAAGISRRS